MTTNHLIIGLGGTGGKIIRAFRKTLFQEFRGRRPEKVKLDFLYVDSSPEMMGLDDPTWKILGTSVQLDQAQQLLIQEANLVTRFENINSFPGIKNWIGDREVWRTILSGKEVGKGAGGQKRRLGRFLFACKIQDFNHRLKLRVAELQRGGETAVTFHICTGLAGGTGGGSLIDAVVQIRHAFRNQADYRLLIYTLLPEDHPKPSWDTGNYHANGYAALLDLNALSAGPLEPHDLTGEQDRLAVPDPFSGCYLFTNQNANGLAVDVERDIPQIAGDFLYQKIVASSALGWTGLDRIESYENGDTSPETDATGRRKERSKKFLAFGVKRLAIPEDEIREYLAYSFTRQAALQLAFNHWSDEVGFRNDARNQEFALFVNEQETRLRWRLTDEHLTLSEPVLPMEGASKSWKPINREWADLVPRFKEAARHADRSQWLDQLARLCEERFNATYRSDMGVRKFYETKKANRKEHAREIRRLIEADLIQDWKNGVKSMHDIGLILDALLQNLRGRTDLASEQITRNKEAEQAAAQKVVFNQKEYAKIGPLSDLMGKRSSLLNAQGTCLQEQLTCRTRAVAWDFALGLLQELDTELNALRAEVGGIHNTILEAVDQFNAALADRCRPEEHDERVRLQQQLVRYYRPQEVIDFSRELVRDRVRQDQQTSTVRRVLLEQLGDNPTFAAFNARISRQQFLDTLESECAQAAVEAHTAVLAANRDRTRLLGANIVDQLAREYSGRGEALKKFLTDLVRAAGHYLTFESTELNKAARGIPNVPTRLRSLTVILPQAEENPAFTATLTEVLRGASEHDVTVVINQLKRNEITLVSIISLFPLRFVSAVGMLREKYAKRLEQGGVRARLEVHSEGDGSGLPPLFVLGGRELRADGLPWLLLAKSLGVVEQGRGASGRTQLRLISKDADGLDLDPLELGSTFLEAVDQIQESNFDLIQTSASERLRQELRAGKDPAAIRKLILAEVEALKVGECGGNIADARYKEILAAARKAMKLTEAPA